MIQIIVSDEALIVIINMPKHVSDIQHSCYICVIGNLLGLIACHNKFFTHTCICVCFIIDITIITAYLWWQIYILP